MRRTYYTQDTSDYRTVSKKICSAQDTKKKKNADTCPPERAFYSKYRFEDLLYRRTVFTNNDVSFFLLKVREAYKTYMKKIAKYLGGGPDSDEQMMKVYEFETKLAMVC